MRVLHHANICSLLHRSASWGEPTSTISRKLNKKPSKRGASSRAYLDVDGEAGSRHTRAWEKRYSKAVIQERQEERCGRFHKLNQTSSPLHNNLESWSAVYKMMELRFLLSLFVCSVLLFLRLFLD
jgi:hypothetical protein